MSKRVILLTFFMFVGSIGYAQQSVYSVDSSTSTLDLIVSSSDDGPIVPDTLKGWMVKWVGGLNGSQAAYSNWSQGGVNTVSVTASTVFNLQYRKNRFAYLLVTNLKYGRADIEGEGTRKTDDKIAVTNKFSYLFKDPKFNAFGSLSFNTQFDEGFDYDPDPEVLISDFFSPAYFTQVLGIGYTPVDYFSVEAGAAFKETVVNIDELAIRYGLDAGENFRFEPGYSVIVNFEKNIVSNVKLISSAETFTNLQEPFADTDVIFSNELIGNINDYLNTSLQFVMIYDEDFSREVQLKQVLSVGFSFNIL